MKLSVIRSVVSCAAAAAAILLPACGGGGPQPPSPSSGASADVVPSAVAEAVPRVQTLTLQPRTPGQPAHHASPGARTKVSHTPSGGGVGASNFQDPTNSLPVAHTVVGGDEVEIYGVSGDATSKDSASNQGGPVIQNVHFQVIFWGTQWATATSSGNSSSQADVITNVQRILKTTYLDDMKQYGWQTADIRGFWSLPTDPPTSYDASTVGDMLWQLIDQGSFPQAGDPGGDNLYLVFMPQLANYAPDETVGGAHTKDGDLLYAWVNFGSVGATTGTFTHEMVESISDPFVSESRGWIMEKSFTDDPNEDEIGDACNHTFDFLDGIIVEAYFSQNEHGCVIPYPAAPTITSINPDQGPESGGQAVTITGTGFDPFNSETQFTFGGVLAKNVHCSSATTCTMITPAGNGTENVVAKARYFNSHAATYLYGPGAPSCTASYACTHNGSGAATITCAESLQYLTLQRLNGGVWQQDNATEQYTSFIDYYYPGAGATISYRVTQTDSFGSATGPSMSVTTPNCACSKRSVCETSTGKQIYPQPTSPPDWCTLQGGHMVTISVCP